jgi:hypothetical protein
MARPKKHVAFDASDQVIADYFDQAMALKDNQRGVSSEITALNSLMQGDGVDPGTLSVCCRLARMKPGKRGVAVAGPVLADHVKPLRAIAAGGAPDAAVLDAALTLKRDEGVDRTCQDAGLWRPAIQCDRVLDQIRQRGGAVDPLHPRPHLSPEEQRAPGMSIA